MNLRLICFHPHHYVKSVRIWSYSGPHFPAFGLNTDRYSVSFRIYSEYRKMRTRITPYTDNVHAVKLEHMRNQLMASNRLLFLKKQSIVNFGLGSKYASMPIFIKFSIYLVLTFKTYSSSSNTQSIYYFPCLKLGIFHFPKVSKEKYLFRCQLHFILSHIFDYCR